LSAATLRSWFLGRPYPTSGGISQFRPVLRPAKRRPPTLSFANLIEAHVLRALRTEHGVPLAAVRQALSYAETELEIDQLLLRQELRTAGGDLFLDRYRQLINLSASGQLAMRRVFEAHLRRIEWGEQPFPIRLFPFVVPETTESRPIVIDPGISFGRPVVTGAFISTQAILDRIDAGESVESVASDYGLATEAIEDAVLFERAA
jgi:uncharacterized protein (DUF433 family)